MGVGRRKVKAQVGSGMEGQGVVRQAMCAALQGELKDFYRLMAVLESQSLNPTPLPGRHRPPSTRPASARWKRAVYHARGLCVCTACLWPRERFSALTAFGTGRPNITQTVPRLPKSLLCGARSAPTCLLPP